MEKIFIEIIETALWAPTPDNMQNWILYQQSENDFEIVIDIEIQHPLDLGSHASQLSLGGLCEYLVIAAQNYGYSITREFLPENSSLKFQFHADQGIGKNELFD